MLPYLLLLFIIAIFPAMIYRTRGVISARGYNYIVHKRNRMTIRLFFWGLFILLALRDITVGKDLSVYEVIYRRCHVTSFENLPNMQWEFGYTVYNKIVSIVVNDFRWFLIITAAITLIPIYKLYSKENKYSFLLIVLFINMPCFLMIFSGLRQAIAISIGIIVYMSLENKKYILSVLLIALAISFHVSAFVLILLYPMFFFEIKTKHLLYIVPIMLIV